MRRRPGCSRGTSGSQVSRSTPTPWIRTNGAPAPVARTWVSPTRRSFSRIAAGLQELREILLDADAARDQPGIISLRAERLERAAVLLDDAGMGILAHHCA